MKVRIQLCFALMGAVCLSACDQSQDVIENPWLVGYWSLKYNPAEDTHDRFLFKDNGAVEILLEQGGELKGNYQIDRQKIRLVVVVGNRVRDFNLKISDDKKRLVFSNGAYYERQCVELAECKEINQH